ncbi:MAG: hypothetical protein M3Z32_05200 [Acidobacteriota bacterium]|nr:hypothetical protein [Acidobacteriota bacterium]
MKSLFALGAGLAAAAFGVSGQENVAEIINRSAAAMENNWKVAPGYSYVERDVQSKKGGPKTTKSYDVSLIEGSSYNRLIAIDDKPLAKEQEQQEEQKLRAEIARRQRESASDRAKRVAKYEKERRQDHAMIAEMSKAFDFKPTGSETVNGHECWVFDAVPKPGYQPKMRDAKVLPAMKGKLWVDKKDYQWAKVQGEVIRPVSFYGVLAKVSPGTRFVLEQEPVNGSLWLPKHFSTNVKASALGFLNQSSTDDETYKDYKPNTQSGALAAGKTKSR